MPTKKQPSKPPTSTNKKKWGASPASEIEASSEIRAVELEVQLTEWITAFQTHSYAESLIRDSLPLIKGGRRILKGEGLSVCCACGNSWATSKDSLPNADVMARAEPPTDTESK